MRTPAARTALALLLGLSGCAEATPRLSVYLFTDLNIERDFDSVAIESSFLSSNGIAYATLAATDGERFLGMIFNGPPPASGLGFWDPGYAEDDAP